MLDNTQAVGDKNQPEKSQNKVSNDAQTLLDLFHTVKQTQPEVKLVGSTLDFGKSHDIFNDNPFAGLHWNANPQKASDMMPGLPPNASDATSSPTLSAAQASALKDILTTAGSMSPEQSKSLHDLLHAIDGMTQDGALADSLRISQNPTQPPVDSSTDPTQPVPRYTLDAASSPKGATAAAANDSSNGTDNSNNGGDLGVALGGVLGAAIGKTPQQITAEDVQRGGMNGDRSTDKTVPDAGGTGVEQSGYGDCWYEATLSALASTPEGAKTIANSIKANPDGTYTVTFPGDKDHPVTVNQNDLNDPKIKDSAQWAKVMEAALVKHDPDHAQHGGWSKEAFKLLTGKDPSEESVHSDGAWWNPFDSGHDALPDIQKALQNGDAVTVSTKGADNPYKGPVVFDHEYQILSVDPKTQTVTLRNPWGENQAGAGAGLPGVGETKDGVTDIGGGEIQVSYDTFRKYFETVDYEAA